MTQAVHESHMGVEKSLQRAKDIMFWPRMTSDITDCVLKCDIHLQYRASSTKQPLQSHQIPDRPWQVAVTDVFTFDNKDYLVTVDYFSRYFEVDLLPTTTSISIIRKLKTIFARHASSKSSYAITLVITRLKLSIPLQRNGIFELYIVLHVSLKVMAFRRRQLAS